MMMSRSVSLSMSTEVSWFPYSSWAGEGVAVCCWTWFWSAATPAIASAAVTGTAFRVMDSTAGNLLGLGALAPHAYPANNPRTLSGLAGALGAAYLEVAGEPRPCPDRARTGNVGVAEP